MKTRTGINTLLAMSIFVLAIAPMAAADIITVDDDGPADYDNIQAAINAAVNGDTVLVADGTYTGLGNRDIDFLGKAITVKSENGPDNCIIDCQNISSHRGFYFHSGEGPDSVISGFTIKRGKIYGSNAKGGGIYCSGSSPTIQNCIVAYNIVQGDISKLASGGGVYIESNGYPTIQNCIITGNKALGGDGQSNPIGYAGNGMPGYGAGICCGTDGAVLVKNCLISYNENVGGDGGFSIIWGSNGGNAYGGGIYLASNALAIIENCTITANMLSAGVKGNEIGPAHDGYEYGGGIYCRTDSTATVQNCIIWDNEGDDEIHGNPDVTYSNIEDGYAGIGNINADPLFVSGPLGDYYLSQTAAGQSNDSPCVDTGSDTAENLGMNMLVTRTDEVDDEGIVDMGYHYFRCGSSGLLEIITPNGGELLLSSRIYTVTWKYSGNINEVMIEYSIDNGSNWVTVDPPNSGNSYTYDWVVPDIDSNQCLMRIGKASDPNIYDTSDDLFTIVNAQYIIDRQVPSEYPTIQAAIDAADDYDFVLVADGIYTGDGNRDIDFKGKAITVCSPNGPGNCIIDCQGSETEPHRGFYFQNGEDGNSVLAGFTIANGYVPRYVSGGGIKCSWSSPTIRNCIIRDNYAFDGGGTSCHGCNATLTHCIFSNNSAYNGGAIYNNTSNTTIKNCTFVENLSDNVGGAIYNWRSGPTLTNCIFNGNSSKHGGGVHNSENSNPTLTNCTFNGNSSKYSAAGISVNNSHLTVINCQFIGNSGPGIYQQDSQLTVTDCNFIDNSKEGIYNSAGTQVINNCNFIGNLGGGIYNLFSNPMVLNCTFTGNFAEDGGGMCNRWSNPTVVNSEFIQNSAEDDGGGICNIESSPILTNCTLRGNLTEEKGGAMYNYQESQPTLLNCIITENSANKDGGAVFSEESIVTLTNCTLVKNSALNGNALACDSSNQVRPSSLHVINCILWNGSDAIWNNDDSTINITYSDIQGGWPGMGNINIDPCFADPCSGDYHPLFGSPCIDTGDPGYLPEPNETDLDGNPRVINGRIDMGAYEANYIEVPMKFTPQALNLSSGGQLVKAHFVLPEGFTVEDVNANTPAVIEPYGIESYNLSVLLNDEGLVRVEATFWRSDLCSSITSYDENIEVMVIGRLTSGQYFYGSDVIKVTDRAFEYLGLFVSYWLEGDCIEPDWCGGADLNADSVVNFLDFALLDRCCIEAVTE